MTQRTTISISDGLWDEMEKFKGDLNYSALFSAAAQEAIKKLKFVRSIKEVVGKALVDRSCYEIILGTADRESEKAYRIVETEPAEAKAVLIVLMD